MYENREEINPRRATGYDRAVDGHVRVLHNYNFDVAAVAADRFEFSFHPRGWSEARPISLEFDRNQSGVSTGFGLSAGSERDIAFERRTSGCATSSRQTSSCGDDPTY